MDWIRAVDGENAFKKAVSAEPGWYWVYRPKSQGLNAYHESKGVLCLVYINAEGELISPLADFRSLSDDDLVCFDDASGRRFVTYFAGPVSPGDHTGTLKARFDGQAQADVVSGEIPKAPTWAWCKTNEEAPLLLVDEAGIGPIFLQRSEGGVDEVYLATDEAGQSVDVGEFGFAEPLVSTGGIIDSTGQLGRVEVQFFGSVAAAPALPQAFAELV